MKRYQRHNSAIYWRIIAVISIGLAMLPLFANEASSTPLPRYHNNAMDMRAKVPELLLQLQSPDETMRSQALTGLVYLSDDRTSEAFLAIISGNDDRGKSDAALGLIFLDNARFLPPIFAVMRNQNGTYLADRLLYHMRDPNALDPLLAESHAKDTLSRSVAAQLLGHIHQPAAADRLYAMTNGDADAEVHRTALRALGGLRDPRALTALQTMITDTRDHDRINAVRLLGLYHDRTLTAKVLPLLTDASAKMRLAAINALGGLADPESVPALIAHLDTADAGEYQAINDALVGIDLAALPSLRAAVFNNPSSLIRLRALRTLLEINDPRESATVRAALDDTDLRVKNRAIHGVVQFKDQQAVPQLLAILHQTAGAKALQEAEEYRTSRERGSIFLHDIEEKYPDGPPVDTITVRLSAISALGSLGDTQVIPVLLKLAMSHEPRVADTAEQVFPHGKAITSTLLPMLKSGDTTRLNRVLRLLDDNCDGSAVPTLCSLIRTNTDEGLLFDAIQDLASIRDPRAREALISLIDHPNRYVRHEALTRLQNFPSHDTAQVLLNYDKRHHDSETRYLVGITLQAAGFTREATPILINQLATCKVYEYPFIAEALCRIGTDDAQEALIASLENRDFANDGTYRWLGYEALAKLSGHRVAVALARESRNPDIHMRQTCIRGLARLADPSTVDSLLYALSDQSSDIRKNAIRGLMRMHATQAQDALLNVLQDDTEAQESAAEAFGVMPDLRALPVLLRMARKNCSEAVMALTAYDSPQIREELREIAQSPDGPSWNRADALHALILLHDAQSRPLFHSALQERDPYLKGWAAVGLAQFGDTDVRPQLEQIERYCSRILGPNYCSISLETLDAACRSALGHERKIYHRHPTEL